MGAGIELASFISRPDELSPRCIASSGAESPRLLLLLFPRMQLCRYRFRGLALVAIHLKIILSYIKMVLERIPAVGGGFTTVDVQNARKCGKPLTERTRGGNLSIRIIAFGTVSNDFGRLQHCRTNALQLVLLVREKRSVATCSGSQR